jgi:anti-anti-sigma regulatory factor
VQHVVVRPPLDAAEAARIRHQLRGGATVRCDVTALTEPDLSTVDALARLRLDARRTGGELCLCGVSPGLRDLLELAGLAELLAG